MARQPEVWTLIALLAMTGACSYWDGSPTLSDAAQDATDASDATETKPDWPPTCGNEGEPCANEGEGIRSCPCGDALADRITVCCIDGKSLSLGCAERISSCADYYRDTHDAALDTDARSK